MTEYPYVSVVIPVLNGSKYINDCIDALKKQNYPVDRYEIVAVDNGSSDDSFQKLKNYNIVVGVTQKKGRAFALNKALEMACGDIICSTDISCIADPDWILSVVKSFENSSVGCVAGEIKLIKSSNNKVVEFQDRINYMSPMHAGKRMSLPFLPYADGANASFRRIVFEQLGRFEERFFKAADVEICNRILLFSDYKIVFDKNAVVWEYGEPTLLSLLKQRYKIGLGQILMKKKYKNLFNDSFSIKKAYWVAIKMFNRIFRENIFKYHLSYDENIMILMRLWQNIGNIHGRIKLKNYKIDELHPKTVRKFVNGFNSEKLRERIILR